VEERGAGAIAGGQATELCNGDTRGLTGANAVVGPPRRGISGGVGIVSVVSIELRGARPLLRQCRITEVAVAVVQPDVKNRARRQRGDDEIEIVILVDVAQRDRDGLVARVRPLRRESDEREDEREKGAGALHWAESCHSADKNS